MPASPECRSVVVVPVKHGDVAKSRLASVAGARRAELARAFAADCVTAARASAAVTDVVAVTDDGAARAVLEALGVIVVADAPDCGLNPALEHGAAFARSRLGRCRVTVLSADLPALRPEELTAALAAAGGFDRAFVADTAATGTTLLTAAPDIALDPRFGTASRAAHHHSGAVELESLRAPGLRRDVDTEVDLWDAVRIGVGAYTAAVLTTMTPAGVPSLHHPAVRPPRG